MKLPLAPYLEQSARWPATGPALLACYDAETVVVYQAYSPEIADWALDHGTFGGPWRLDRMSWIKTSFLWMMHRSGWGSKPDQERVLAVRLRREGFEAILAKTVPSRFESGAYADQEAWQAALRASDVRLQWDPDHGPRGERLERRAIQLGLRGGALRAYTTDWLVGIEDVTALAHDGARRIAGGDIGGLMVPVETALPVADATALRLGLSGG